MSNAYSTQFSASVGMTVVMVSHSQLHSDARRVGWDIRSILAPATLEAIQKRAIQIILNFSRGMPYSSMLFAADLTTLASRRDISRKFFYNITNQLLACAISYQTKK